MDERDPELLTRFRSDSVIEDFHRSEAEFSGRVQAELDRLTRKQTMTRRLLIFLILPGFMAALGYLLVTLSGMPMFNGAPNYANNLTTPLGALVIFAWVVFRQAARD